MQYRDPGTNKGLKINEGRQLAGPAVSIMKCEDYQKKAVFYTLEKCIDQIGGLDKYIKGAKKILLKPNLLSAQSPEKAVTTHPVFIEAVIDLVRKYASCEVNMTIADSPGAATSHTKKELVHLYKNCGLLYLGDMKDVTLNVDDSYKTVSYKEGLVFKHMEIIKPVLDADIIINLPKFKTHSLTRITGAVKNMFGVIHGRTKTVLHTKFMDIEKFSDMLIDVYSCSRPVLNIMDGITGLEGEGPGASGRPRDLKVVLASSNGIAMDHIVSMMMGFKAADVPLMKCAKNRGMPGTDFDEIKILGDYFTQPGEIRIPGFMLPKKTMVDSISKNTFFKTYVFPFIRNTLSPSPYQDIQKCNLCGICSDICPEKAIIQNDKKLIFDYKKCIRCYCCSEMCPYAGISLKYSWLGDLIFNRKTIK